MVRILGRAARRVAKLGLTVLRHCEPVEQPSCRAERDPASQPSKRRRQPSTALRLTTRAPQRARADTVPRTAGEGAKRSDPDPTGQGAAATEPGRSMQTHPPYDARPCRGERCTTSGGAFCASGALEGREREQTGRPSHTKCEGRVPDVVVHRSPRLRQCQPTRTRREVSTTARRDQSPPCTKPFDK
jgi:hypothetical protein